MTYDFAEKMVIGANDIVRVVKDSIKFGATFEDVFPALSYVIVKENGKTFQMKIEVTLKEI